MRLPDHLDCDTDSKAVIAEGDGCLVGGPGQTTGVHLQCEEEGKLIAVSRGGPPRGSQPGDPCVPGDPNIRLDNPGAACVPAPSEP
jgi:hypothetical protein